MRKIPNLLLLLSLNLLAACKDKGVEGGQDGLSGDADGDGFPSSVDCDDHDTRVNPDAEEICDGLDNDCDGEVDPGLTISAWVDADGDNYGDPSSSLVVCTLGEGQVDNGEDCDDTNPEVYPAAPERCDGIDQDCDGTLDEDVVGIWYIDADADGFGALGSAPVESCDPGPGYAATADDCNDSLDSAFPGAPEVCDAEDNDCDSEIDEELFVSWYLDGDGDGFGDPLSLYESCAPTEGSVENGDDCDDTLATVFPGNPEVCDGLDNDCEGGIDEEASDQVTVYLDADLDGYGLESSPSLACEVVSGFSLVFGDCDDGDATANPDGLEICGGGDEDCNGLVDDVDVDEDGFAPVECLGGSDCLDSDPAAYPGAVEVWYDGVDQDCLGGDDFDADGDGYASEDYAGTDCEDSLPAIHPGVVEICGDGYDNNCDNRANSCGMSGDYLAADADLIVRGEAAGDRAGQGDPGVGAVGDLNGDGIDDLAVGGIRNDAGGTDAGALYLIWGGSTTGTVNLASANLKITGEAAGDLLGRSMARIGDTDGDGFDDLLVSAQDEQSAGVQAGAAYLLHGPLSVGGSVGLSGLGSAKITGAAAGDLLADVARGGDVNGDGFADWLVGAQFYDPSGRTDAGAVALFSGSHTGTQVFTAGTALIEGSSAGDELGSAISGGEDIDGDGLTDLLVGARRSSLGASLGGAVGLFYGPVSGTLDFSAADAVFTAAGADDDLGGGAAVGLIGDMDGDGFGEVAMGARNNDANGTNAGAVYLFDGPVSLGSRSVTSARAIFYGEAARDLTGDSVAPAGDSDGDGRDELLIGSGYNDAGAADAGAAYLIIGLVPGTASLSTAADARFLPESAGDRVRTAGAGDFNDDGFFDFVVAAQNNSTSGAQAGAAFMFFGEGI